MQGLPENRHSNKEAMLKSQLPRTPLKLDLTRLSVHLLASKLQHPPSAPYFPAPLSPVIAVSRSLDYMALSTPHQISISSSAVNGRQSAQWCTTTPPPMNSSNPEGKIYDFPRAIAAPCMTIFKFHLVRHSSNFPPIFAPHGIPQPAINALIFYAAARRRPHLTDA